MTGLFCRRSLRALCLLFVALLLHGQTSANLPEARTQRGPRARAARVTRADVDHDAEANLVGQSSSRHLPGTPDGSPEPDDAMAEFGRLALPLAASLPLGPPGEPRPVTTSQPAPLGRAPPSFALLSAA